MRNPFGSESDAYGFVLLTVAAFALVVVASVSGGPWAGIPVWAAVTALALGFYLRRGRSQRPEPTAGKHVGGPDERRILVLARGALSAHAVERVKQAAAGYRAQVVVVCPAPVSALHHWTSDVDEARHQAGEMLVTSLMSLQLAGIEARGIVGDEDPFRAVEDALRTFGADELIVAGLDQMILARARERFAVPVGRVNGQPA